MPDIELQLARPPPPSRSRPGRETGSVEAADGKVRGSQGSAEDRPDVPRLVLREIAPLLPWRTERLPPDAGPPRDMERRRAFRRIDVEEFATLAICPDCDLWPYVEDALGSGVAVQAILEDLLAPAARRLGDLWETDDCDFLSVTTGVHRLQVAIRKLSSGWQGREGASALFLPAPGETHVLGLSIVRAAFEQFGWSTDVSDTTGVYAIVRRRWFDLVAFSVSCDRLVAGVADAAARIRRVSRNRNVFLLVGGPAVASRPELAASIGADALAATPQEAVVITRSLLRRRERRQPIGL